MKKICITKNICMFAASNRTRWAVFLLIISMSNFCVHGSSKGVSKLCVCYNDVHNGSASGLTGGKVGAPSFFYCTGIILNSFSMSNQKEVSLNGRTPSNRATYDSGTSRATLALQVSNPYGIVCFPDLAAEMQKQYDVEKNAKNKAYSFILSSGLLNRFAEYCRSNYSDDWHDTCLRQLELLVTSKN